MSEVKTNPWLNKSSKRSRNRSLLRRFDLFQYFMYIQQIYQCWLSPTRAHAPPHTHTLIRAHTRTHTHTPHIHKDI